MTTQTEEQILRIKLTKAYTKYLNDLDKEEDEGFIKDEIELMGAEDINANKILLEDCKEELRLLNNLIRKINHIKGNPDNSTNYPMYDEIKLFKFKNDEIDDRKIIRLKSLDKAYKKINKYKNQALERYNLLLPILHSKIDEFNKAVKNYNQSVDIYNEWFITKAGGHYSNKKGKTRTKNKRGKKGDRIMRLIELNEWIKDLNEKTIELIIS